jgi:hypothetical protein
LLSGRFGLALAALVGAAVGVGVGMSSGADDAAERGAGAAVGAGVALAGVAFIRKKFLPFLKGGKIKKANNFSFLDLLIVLSYMPTFYVAFLLFHNFPGNFQNK